MRAASTIRVLLLLATIATAAPITAVAAAVPETVPTPYQSEALASTTGQAVVLPQYPQHSYQILPDGLIYAPYLAGVKESRFRSVWNFPQEGPDIWDVTLGGRVGMLRCGTCGPGRPQGWQLDIEGAGQVRLNLAENRDVEAADFRFGIPLTWGDYDLQWKLAYYHLSSHVGDEFLIRNPTFVRRNYSRDTVVLGNSWYATDRLRLYGEAGWAFTSDVSEPWEFQFGVEYAPTGCTGIRGEPFFAANAHLREEVDFGGTLTVQTGWAWRRSWESGIFRFGVEYYNGQDDQFSFFDESVEKIGLGLWYDY